MKQVADNAWVGTGTVVNWLVVREGDALTLVDSGWPGDIGALEASLACIGQHPRDIKAVLLTHAHVDHMGGLNVLWRRYRVPVFMHPAELPMARGERREQATPMDILASSWRPRVAVWGTRILLAGGLRHPTIEHANAWDSNGPLDLPGSPVPVPCVGHTSGHTAYLFPDQGVIATGDALVTEHPASGRKTPHLLPSVYHKDIEEARRSLQELAVVDADTVVPGHGYVWSGSLKSAVRAAGDRHDVGT
ncbi:MBL fold metallo-hydrolase [Streptomyces djakartensis]|uniref:MBL fold metallo-hydrolase n=1 Tax=Streptomyces djakartensis TaxID=68193 RepID=UPI0034DE6F44